MIAVIVNYPDSDIKFNLDVKPTKAIGTNQTIVINGIMVEQVNTSVPQYFSRLQFKLDLKYRDEDKNLYKQIITRK